MLDLCPLRMEKDANIFHLMQTLIVFTEEKHARDLVPIKSRYETLREEILLALKEQQQNEETFARFHDDVTVPKQTVQTCQSELLEEARNKLTDRDIKWIENFRRCDCNKDISFPMPNGKHFQD